MRKVNSGSEFIEPLATGERAVCPECQSMLYSRSLPDTINEFTWVHSEAGNCSLSSDRDYVTYSRKHKSSCRSRSNTNDLMPSNKQKLKQLQQNSEQRLERLKQVNEQKLKQLKQEVRTHGTLAKARECILHAITFKSQASIPGILAGLKKYLTQHGASAVELKNLNEMTTKNFYLSQRAT